MRPTRIPSTPSPTRRRVLVITYDFPPSMEMGAQACSQIARHLPQYGWDPVVLTVQGRYIERLERGPLAAFPGPVTRTRVLPHPLSVYASLTSTFRATGSAGADSRDPASQMGRLRRWVGSLLAVPDVYTGWILPATVAGVREIRRRAVNHLFSSGPCWTNHVLGLVLARLTGLPWTAHFRDPWTDAPGWAPRSAVAGRLETMLQNRVMRRATSVVCVTEQHTDWMRRVYRDAPRDKFVTIPNGFDEAEWREVERALEEGPEAAATPFVVTYAGWLYHRRNPLPLFRAVRALLNSGELDRAGIRIELIGWCDVADGRRVTDLAAECGIADCVTITGPLSRALTLRRLARSSLLLLLAEELTLQIPGKTYDYLRAGRPILALASGGAVSELLRKTGGAWVFDPTDEDGIARAVREAYQDWRSGGNRGTAGRASLSGFDRHRLAGRFADVFERGARSQSGPPPAGREAETLATPAGRPPAGSRW